MTKQKQAFTLVELIVVITILAILWTIAFISLQWYSKDARDSIRISDTSNMKTSLELFHLNAGKYPLPDDNGSLTYSWNTLFYQWYFWDNVIKNISRNMTEVPRDPLTGKRYIYSVSNNRNELEILSLLEWDWIALNIIWQTSAAWTEVIPIITWNYNGLFIKTSAHIVPIPSIINTEVRNWVTSEITQLTLESTVIDRWDNVPEQWNVVASTWSLIWLVLTWALIPDADADDETKAAVIEVIKAAYVSETALNTNWVYNYVLNESVDNATLAWLFDTIVLNETIRVITPSFTCWDSVSAWWETYTTTLWPDLNCWTSQNMNHWIMLTWSTVPSDINIIEKWCYSDDSNNCDTDWWFYTWSEAMWFDVSCDTNNCIAPENTTYSVCWQLWTWWFLPTTDQWLALTEAWATWWTWNKFSWIVSTLPGYRGPIPNFSNRLSSGNWWTSTERDITLSWSRNLFLNATVYGFSYFKNNGFSVVCIKN